MSEIRMNLDFSERTIVSVYKDELDKLCLAVDLLARLQKLLKRKVQFAFAYDQRKPEPYAIIVCKSKTDIPTLYSGPDLPAAIATLLENEDAERS